MEKNKKIGSNKIKKAYKWPGKKILIVEDVETNNMFFEAALQKTNAVLIWAEDGIEAINAIKNDPGIDVILMDMRLPNMDGFEATRQIKATNPDIPIIAQTTYVLPNEKIQIFEAGCDEYIPKPIRFESLMEVINKFIGSNST